jgi:hypothetical protein
MKRSSTGTNNSGISTDITNSIARASTDSMGKTSSHLRKHGKKSATSDTGPRRGNRAAPSPIRLSAPDVQTYLKHLATHRQRASSATGTSPHPSHNRQLEANGWGPTFKPQYAARNHGDMVPNVFPLPQTTNTGGASSTAASVKHGAMITKGVWSKLSREQSFQRKKSSPPERRDSGTGNDVLQSALRDRGTPE